MVFYKLNMVILQGIIQVVKSYCSWNKEQLELKIKMDE